MIFVYLLKDLSEYGILALVYTCLAEESILHEFLQREACEQV